MGYSPVVNVTAKKDSVHRPIRQLQNEDKLSTSTYSPVKKLMKYIHLFTSYNLCYNLLAQFMSHVKRH